MRSESKNFLFLLTFMALFSACGQKSQVESFAIFEYQAQLETKMKGRSLAQDSKLECRGDYFQIPYLKEEIKKLELALEGKKKISGSWKHLNLEKLPVPQAEFLKRYSGQLGDYNKQADYDFSSCSDVPCILNTIYKKPQGIEGYAIYYWFLKMGNILSVDNFLKGQSSPLAGEYQGKKWELETYLWDKDELYAFWRMANMLSTRYSILPRLTEIQRIPRGAKFENTKDMPDLDSACGLAFPAGVIMLADACIPLEKTKEKKELGEFYASVIHEMTHQVDYTMGVGVGGYYSQTDEWKKEAGWYIKEVVNKETGESEREWDATLKDTQWVSRYAATEPAEHFAETSSYYRQEADRVFKTIPDSTYKLLKNKIWDNKSYEADALSLTFIPQLEKDELEIFNMTKACLQTTEQLTLTPEENKKLAVYGNGLDNKRAGCLTRSGIQKLKKLVAKIKAEELDGCKIYNDGFGTKLESFLELALKKKIEGHVKNALADENYFDKLNNFYATLNNPKIATQAYISCYGEVDEALCYEKMIESKVKNLIPDNVNFSEVYRGDLVKKFLSGSPYNKVQEETLKLYSNFIFSSQETIRESAQNEFNHCKALPPNDQNPPKVKDISPGEHYVVSSLINCLNEDTDKALQFIIDNLNSDILIKAEKERLIILDLLRPLYVKSMKDILLKDIEDEKHLLKVYKEEQGPKIKESIISNFSWLVSYTDKSKQKGDCLKVAQGKLDLSLSYHLKGDEFSNFISDICEQVIVSPEMKKYLDDHYLSSLDAAMEELLRFLNTSGRARASNCLSFYPHGLLKDFLYAKKRVACLEDQWKLLENNALKKFKKEGLGSKYSYDEAALLSRYKTESRKLKDRIIEEELQ